MTHMSLEGGLIMYDLIIIGGGIAGYHGASVAAGQGLKVLLIDKHRIGGTHIYRGSVPLTYLLNNTYGDKEIVKDEDHPIYDHSYSAVIKLKEKECKSQSRDITKDLEDKGVDVIKGGAKIIGRSYQGFVVQCNNDDYVGKRLLLATGSKPFISTIPGVKKATYSGFVLSSDNVLEINNIPKDLVIIGGGIIGLEIASYFNDLGCHITIIEKRSRVGKALDPSLSNAIADSYTKQGIKIITDSEVIGIENQKVHYLNKGIDKEIACERVLLSIGRIPEVDDLGLDTLGVTFKDGIKVNEFGQTSIEDVYASGDVLGNYMYETNAYMEAEKSVLNMLDQQNLLNQLRVVVSLKTKPEIAFIGEDKNSAKNKKLQVREIFTKNMEQLHIGVETIEYEAFTKLIINQSDNKIIGIHVFGEKAGQMICVLKTLIDSVYDEVKVNQLYESKT